MKRKFNRPFGPHPLGPDGSVPVYVSMTEFARVSPADYVRVMQYKWRPGPDGYPMTWVWNLDVERGRFLFLHRLIARAPQWMQVDHRHHDILDCRRESLRWATSSQNSANTRRSKVGCSSPYRGVVRHPSGGWQVTCASRYVGFYRDEIDAAKAYNRRARALYGKFALLNVVTSTSARRRKAA